MVYLMHSKKHLSFTVIRNMIAENLVTIKDTRAANRGKLRSPRKCTIWNYITANLKLSALAAPWSKVRVSWQPEDLLIKPINASE